MNQATLEHPVVAQLSAFVSGRLNDAESAEIESHLADCSVCCAVLEQLPQDSLGALLQPLLSMPYGSATPWESTSQPSTGAAVPGEERAPAGRLKTTPANFQAPAELADHPRYKIVDLLGVGGMGAVYKAEHRHMERLVALKVISPRLINSPAAVERFQREVKLAARLVHPNIVTAYDADQANDLHFLVMEYVEGKSLGQVVTERGSLPIPQACDYVRQAALGLQHACDCGMVHRDIKPHNLMLTPQGQVKILDFGLARFVRESPKGEVESSKSEIQNLRTEPLPNTGAQGEPVLQSVFDPCSTLGSNVVSQSVSPGEEGENGVSARAVTVSGQVLGTVDYIAPEQGRDPHQADIRSDVYSLGCTLYYLLAGRSPFAGGSVAEKLAAHGEQRPTSLSAFRSDLPANLEQVIQRLMAKDPSKRFQTPADVAEALTPFAKAGEARASYPPNKGQDGRGPQRWQLFLRRRAIIISSVFALLLLALFVGLVAHRQFSWEPDSFQVGSQWRGYFRFLHPIKEYYGDVRVSITERQGNTFKGSYVTEDDQYEWEIDGTLDQGSIRWEFTRVVREKHPTHVVGSAIVEGRYEGKNMELHFRHPYDNSEADMVMVQVK